MSFDRWFRPPEVEFDRMVDLVIGCLYSRTGIRNSPSGKYFVNMDYLHWGQILLHIVDLSLLTPSLVADLQKLLQRRPRWEIVVIVCEPDGATWPDMGLYIRRDEIIDALQRSYFPLDFQSLVFEGARPGTVAD